MDIAQSTSAGTIELAIDGRLDGYWADHLDHCLADTLRAGHDRIRLDLAKVTFMSSAGIAVLVKFYKQLQKLDGSLIVVRPSAQVRTVLQITRLDGILIESGEPAEAPAGQVDAERFERAGAAFEVYELAGAGSLRCRSVGHDGPLGASAFRDEDCTCLKLTDSSFAFGIGAIGDGVGECRGRFGEFLAVGGVAAYLPADGTGVPDYLMGSGQLMPTLQVLCGLSGDGSFARLARFDAASGSGSIGLAELAACGLEIAGSDAAGVVIVGEASGLVGAALRRSPAEGGDGLDLFAFPAIRSHLSFTAEPAFARSLTLAVGVVAREAAPELRPLGGAGDPFGHVHAAAFSFGPLRRGRLDLTETVVRLFETEKLLGVLHLLNDSRDLVGIGQSRFIRGACWIGPIHGGWERR